jgi:O-antigen ligase
MRGRTAIPEYLLIALPFLLFLRSGVVYTGVVLFLAALALAGDYRERWKNMRESVLFWPVVFMSAISIMAAIFLDRSAEKFWSGLAHYQIYLFLLVFISVGPGIWQQRAAQSFFVGALFAATLFHLKALGALPDLAIFSDYIHYSGNGSILLGILLALAGGALFHDVLEGEPDRKSWLRAAAFLYIATAVLFVAETRTGALLLVVFCAMALFKAALRSWPRALSVLTALILVLVFAWHYSPFLQSRVLQTTADVRTVLLDAEPSHEDVRLEMYRITFGIIAEKPLTGHGIARWMPLYQERSKGLPSEHMAAPHNDYLLYATEIGFIGLGALLYLWYAQLAAAWRIGGRPAMWVGMLTAGIMVGAVFNAMLRDSVFGMAFMVLLAIPLAGARSSAWNMVKKRVQINA